MINDDILNNWTTIKNKKCNDLPTNIRSIAEKLWDNTRNKMIEDSLIDESTIKVFEIIPDLLLKTISNNFINFKIIEDDRVKINKLNFDKSIKTIDKIIKIDTIKNHVEYSTDIELFIINEINQAIISNISYEIDLTIFKHLRDNAVCSLIHDTNDHTSTLIGEILEACDSLAYVSGYGNRVLLSPMALIYLEIENTPDDIVYDFSNENDWKLRIITPNGEIFVYVDVLASKETGVIVLHKNESFDMGMVFGMQYVIPKNKEEETSKNNVDLTIEAVYGLLLLTDQPAQNKLDCIKSIKII